jgi:hypothetical protein
MSAVQVYPSAMPLMSKKKQPFIIDENLSAKLKSHLPADAKTTIERGVRTVHWFLTQLFDKPAVLFVAKSCC